MCIIHGDYRVVVEGKLINVTLLGAFNEHAVIELSSKIKVTVEGFNGNGFYL